MKRSGSYAVQAVLLSVVLIGFSAGQVATGTPALGSFAGGPDIVNLGNLNTHLDIPIARKAGRGTNFNYDLTYDSSIWKKVTVSGTPTWQPTNTATVAGWQGLIPAGMAYIGNTMTSFSSQCGMMGQSSFTEWTYSNFYYYDQFGTSHPMSTGSSLLYIQGGDGSNSCPPVGPEPPTVPWSLTSSDGSGYSIYISPGSGGYLGGSVVDAHGTTINAPVISNPPNYWGSTSTTDRNGNQITSSNGSYTDTLNTTALTVIGTAPSNTNLSYTPPSGSPPATYVVSYAAYTEHTNFGCSGIAEYPATSTSLVDKVTLPDGTFYQFSYETTPGDTHTPHYVDGRIASVTLPTGGTISYTYTNGNLTGSAVSNGIVCADGSTAGLTRLVTPGGTSPAGTWTYARTQVSGAHWQTTTTDPTTAQNQSVIDFWEDSTTYNFYPTQVLAYQGSSAQGGGGTLLTTNIICYNNTNPTPSSCPTTTVSTPINNQTVFSYLPDASGQQAETFVSYYQGVAALPTEIDSYNFATGSVGALARKVVTAYSSFAGALLPTSAVVKDGSNNVVANTTFFYDQGGVTTTGAKQHVSISGARGNLTAVATQVNSTKTLYRNFDYYDTGMVKDSYDYSLSSTTSGPKTSFTYDNTGTPPKACEYTFPTTITLPITTLALSMTWNCNGGVQTAQTDANGHNTAVTYTDPSFWRAAGTTDQLNYSTAISYSGHSAVDSALLFNNNNSVTELRAQIDGIGRLQLSQRREGPNSSNYDTTETDYDIAGRLEKVTLPFVAAAGGTNSSAPGTTYSSYDGLSRPLVVGDSGGGSVTYVYFQNDVAQTIGPAPSGENAKSKQLEYDAVGHLASVCEITSATGSGNCAQTSSKTGFWTKYVYDALGDLTGVTQNAQAAANSQQIRAYTYDMLGRILTETNPEMAGSVQYVYDSDSACGTTSYPGNLVKRVDASGNVTCYGYDSLQHVVSITYLSGGPNTANTATKHFVYGTANSTTISGIVLTNTAGRMVEAYTCFGACTSKRTDLLLSYSARGEASDMYESTPNSGTGYYHVNSQYWANGGLNTLSFFNSNGTALIPTITYSADSEGRTGAITAASGTNPVYSIGYNAASQVTGMNYMASGNDNDVFTFDPNTLRLTDYQFNIGSTVKQDWGHLNWNQNGTLGSLAITDALNTANSQTCNYTYDDLGRLASKVPTTPNIVCGTKWSQTITLDPFGNISKSATVGTNFQATYTSNPPTNRIATVGSVAPNYDANGNLTFDATTSTMHQYTWDAEGKMLTVDNGTSGGVCLTYDALERMVEQGRGITCSTYTQIVYTPTGSKLALLSGQILQKAFVPLTGAQQQSITAAVCNTFGTLTGWEARD
jgi:YD repeat-containing protein